MEEEILIKGKKNLKYYLFMMGIVMLYILIFSSFFLFWGVCSSMLDFAFTIMSSMLLIFILIMGLKITLSYFNDEVYLTKKEIVLKRGKKTYHFPLENVIKLRCAQGLYGIISIRTRAVKKYLIFCCENSGEFYHKYIEAREQISDILPEHDKENPIAFVFIMLAFVAVLCVDIFHDNLESMPAPDFIQQENSEIDFERKNIFDYILKIVNNLVTIIIH